jgi:DNA (cytosine-5)-methyltransferase 1
MPKTKSKMIDQFADCGGFSLGLEQAGFTTWFVNEIVEQFANIFRVNRSLSDEHKYIGKHRFLK